MVKCIYLILIVTFALLLATATYYTTMYFLLFDGRGKTLKYQVTHVWVDSLNLTNHGTVLQYHIAINSTVENPNRKSEYIIDRVEAGLYSAINQTGLIIENQNQTYWEDGANPKWFRVEHKRVKIFNAWIFEGKKPVALGADEVSKFENSTKFDLILKLNVNCYTKIGGRRRRYNHVVSCYLNKVPFWRTETPQNAINCDVDRIIKTR